MRSTASASGRITSSYKTIRSFESELGHLFFKVFLLTLRAANGFGGFKDNGFKIIPTVQTGIFINRHKKLSLIFFFLIPHTLREQRILKMVFNKRPCPSQAFNSEHYFYSIG
jgi:hypothetical protein